MYQNYYETVIDGLIAALRKTNLPVRVQANNDHSFTLHFFDQCDIIRPIDDVIGAHRSRIYALCKTHKERQELQFVINTLTDTLWMVPKDHWSAFKRVADQMLH